MPTRNDIDAVSCQQDVRLYGAVIESTSRCLQATQEVISRVPLSTEAEFNEAVQAAKSAFPAWSRSAVGTRARVMFKLQQLIWENKVNICREVFKKIIKVPVICHILLILFIHLSLGDEEHGSLKACSQIISLSAAGSPGAECIAGAGQDHC